MKLLKKAFAFIFIFMLSVSELTGYQVNASEEPKHLDILFTHDLHSHLNSFQTMSMRKRIQIHLYWMEETSPWEL